MSEGNLSLTILVLFSFAWLCLSGTGVARGTEVEAAGLGGGTGAALGRDAGMFGRDGAGVDGREFGAEEPGTVLVLILILGPEEGIGEWIGDGADMTFGTLTGAGFGRGGAGACAVVTVVVGVGADTGETVGSGTGVFAIGAGVGAFFGGDTAGGLDGFGGSTGDSCLTVVGCGAGDAFRETGADIATGDACLIGGEKADCGLDRAEGGLGDDAPPDVLDLPNLRDSFGFGGATMLGGAACNGTTGTGGS